MVILSFLLCGCVSQRQVRECARIAIDGHADLCAEDGDFDWTQAPGESHFLGTKCGVEFMVLCLGEGRK